MSVIEQGQKKERAKALRAGAASLGGKLGFQDTAPAKHPLPANGLFPAVDLNRVPMQPGPINPDWILEGKPEARYATLSTGTFGRSDTKHWSCTAGSFEWHFAWDETVLILEGEVFVTDAAGHTYHGRPGTSMFFPAGTSATWHVPEYVRKIAFNNRPLPWILHTADRVLGRLKRLLGLQAAMSSGLGAPNQ